MGTDDRMSWDDYGKWEVARLRGVLWNWQCVATVEAVAFLIFGLSCGLIARDANDLAREAVRTAEAWRAACLEANDVARAALRERDALARSSFLPGGISVISSGIRLVGTCDGCGQREDDCVCWLGGH